MSEIQLLFLTIEFFLSGLITGVIARLIGWILGTAAQGKAVVPPTKKLYVKAWVVLAILSFALIASDKFAGSPTQKIILVLLSVTPFTYGFMLTRGWPRRRRNQELKPEPVSTRTGSYKPVFFFFCEL